MNRGCAFNAVEYMQHEIKHICTNMKKRAPGSPGERKAAEYMAETLEKECGCSSVKTEFFKEHPDSFYGYFYFSAFFDVVSWAGYYINPLVSGISGCVALLLFIFHFVLYKQIIDPFFKIKTGTNVTAVRKCSGEVRYRLFINGHVDAAWEFPLNYRFGGVVFEIPGVMALVGVLTLTTFSFLSFAGLSKIDEIFFYGIIFVPFFLLVAITYNPKITVDGANDNLSGCYMGISLLKEMEMNKINLKHTEVGVIITSSEEAGLRGAKAWSREHKDDYKDVPTYILSFDTIHDPEYLAINERDLNGTVKADKDLGNLFIKSAEDLGITCKRSWVPPLGGSTDSAAFTQAGFRSIGITGLNHKLESYYHTRKDSWDNMNKNGLYNCYSILQRFVELLDEEDSTLYLNHK